MRRLLLLTMVALAACLAPAGGAAARARVALPAHLQALLDAGARLHVSDAIVQSTSTVNGGNGFQTSTGTTEARLSPPELAASSGTGAQAVRERLVGGSIYLELPGLAAIAHGRHWLRATPRQLGVTIPQILGAAQEVPGHPSAGLNKASAVRALLADATSVRELGPSALGGTPVTEFLATVKLAQLLGAPASVSAGLNSTVYVQLYFAADGLLKRLSVDLDELVTTTTDLLTDTVPVVVHRPPARDVAPYSRGLVQALLQSLASASDQPSGSGTGPAPVPFDVSAWSAAARGRFGPLGNLLR
jgi:hypothetical protein